MPQSNHESFVRKGHNFGLATQVRNPRNADELKKKGIRDRQWNQPNTNCWWFKWCNCFAAIAPLTVRTCQSMLQHVRRVKYRPKLKRTSAKVLKKLLQVDTLKSRSQISATFGRLPSRPLPLHQHLFPTWPWPARQRRRTPPSQQKPWWLAIWIYTWKKAQVFAEFSWETPSSLVLRWSGKM